MWVCGLEKTGPLGWLTLGDCKWRINLGLKKRKCIMTSHDDLLWWQNAILSTFSAVGANWKDSFLVSDLSDSKMHHKKEVYFMRIISSSNKGLKMQASFTILPMSFLNKLLSAVCSNIAILTVYVQSTRSWKLTFFLCLPTFPPQIAPARDVNLLWIAVTRRNSSIYISVAKTNIAKIRTGCSHYTLSRTHLFEVITEDKTNFLSRQSACKYMSFMWMLCLVPFAH